MKSWQAQAPAPLAACVIAALAMGSSSSAQSGSARAERNAIAVISMASAKWCTALLRQRERAADHSQDDRSDDLRGAGAVKIEGLELADPREQFGVGEIAEDVDVELRSVGIEQRRERRPPPRP